MIDITIAVSIGALLVSVWLAVLQWRRYSKDRKLAERAALEHDFKAPAERDSIIVAGAQEAVTVLKLTLSDTREENEKLRLRVDRQDQIIDTQAVVIADQEKRIRHLERELARINYEGKP